MLIKIGIITLFGLIFITLVIGSIFLVQKGKFPHRLNQAMWVRVSLSLLVLLVLAIAYQQGWLHPHTIFQPG